MFVSTLMVWKQVSVMRREYETDYDPLCSYREVEAASAVLPQSPHNEFDVSIFTISQFAESPF